VVAAEFGRLVVRHRRAAGLTQEQLAHQADLSVRGIRYLESGERVPYPDTVSRLAAALSLPGEERRDLTLAAAAARGRISDGLLPEPLPQPGDVIGRSADVNAIAALLHGGARIVTVTGPGGVGKTTVAAATARQLDSEYTGGLRWTSLATVDNPGRVRDAIRQALGVLSPRDAAATASRLGDESWLVVVDDLDQVTDAATWLVDLLALCPGLQFMATSRTALRVRPEQEYRLAPLALPAEAGCVDMAEVLKSPAVQLFQHRARSVDHRFTVTEDNAAAVVAICRRIDGLPLALELAAARVRVFDPAEIVAHLDRPLDLLTNGPGDAPDRHRSLRAAIAWSHGLLSHSEQRLFRSLSVFEDGANLGAITYVCGDRPDHRLVDDLEALVRSSLVSRHLTNGRSRYRLLEMIREYANEQLVVHAAESETVRTRHASYFAKVAADAGKMIEGPHQAGAMACLDNDRRNILAAITQLITEHRGADGLRAMTATWMYFYIRGYAAEGCRNLAALLALTGSPVPPQLRAAGLLAAGQLARAMGDLDHAAARAAESVALFRITADRRGLASALLGAGFIARVRHADVQAREFLTEALATARSVNHTYIVAAALHHLGMLELDAADDRSAARHLLQESLGAYQAMGFPRMIGIVLATLGNLEMLDDDPGQAQRHFVASLHILIDAGEPREIHFPLEGLADLEYAGGRVEHAITLAAAAAAYRSSLRGRAIGPPLPGRCSWLQRARTSLPERRFAAAWNGGETLSPYDAVAKATSPGHDVQEQFLGESDPL
jgi:predicted ATPase/transcriptional regulator with XRE-family HTH domain